MIMMCQYTHGSCCISLFEFKSFDQFNPPRTASSFRYSLSCGTIIGVSKAGAWDANICRQKSGLEQEIAHSNSGDTFYQRML